MLRQTVEGEVATRDEVLAAKEAKLRAELKAIEEEKKRRQNLTPDVILDRMFNDPRFRKSVAEKVYEETGCNPPEAAKILRTSVADMHNARKGK